MEAVNTKNIITEKKTTKIFTFGSCISRDIFNHTPEGEYEVELNIQRMSYALLPTKGYPVKYEDIDMEYLDDFPWEVKMMVTEMSKTAFSLVADSHADYVLIDLIEERFDFVEFEVEGEVYRCVNSGHFENYYEKYLKDKAKNYRTFSIDEYSDKEVRDNFTESISRLLEYYDISQVILLETYYAKKMIDDEGNITEYENQSEIEKSNERLKRVYRIMREVLESFAINDRSYHLIEAGQEVLGYANHKWGPFPVHYTDEFYEEMGREISCIVG